MITIRHPRPARDMTGRTVGSLLVLGYLGKDRRSDEWWLCRCGVCLEDVPVRGSHLRQNAVRTCGGVGCRGLGRRRKNRATNLARSRPGRLNDGMEVRHGTGLSVLVLLARGAFLALFVRVYRVFSMLAVLHPLPLPRETRPGVCGGGGVG